MGAEFIRDFDFSDPNTIRQHIPRTDEVIGFIDQHIGSSAEAIEVYMASRAGIALISKAAEIITDKKIPPRIQVADPLDVFGPVVVGIFAYSSYEVTQKLFGAKEHTIPTK